MKNMLGNNESLRELFQGPISDLLVKLNGEDGQEVLVELNKFNRREPCWISNPLQEPARILPNLTQTGNTFADWLEAGELLHFFLTGEKVKLQEMFEIPTDLLSRTDIMPVFRPAGASNRIAMNWRLKLGENAPYKETDVMKYRNSEGPKVPELYYINRSITPDADTLGRNAKSPDGLMETKKLWLNLYGWSYADILLSLITGKHLDSGETWTWFPDDRLPGDRKVASGYWDVDDAQANFGWDYRSSCCENMGARVAIPLPLKP